MVTPGALLHRVESGAWPRRVLPALTALVALVYVVGVLATAGARGSFVKGDARAYFAYLPTLVIDRDLDLRNQFAVLQPEGDTDVPFGEARRGGASNPFPIVPALLWLPGYVVGLAVDALRQGGAAAAPLGYGTGAVLGAAVWSILLAGVAAELTRRVVRACVGADAALAATVLAWLATPAIYYTGISPLYSHAAGWFAVSLMLWLTWRAASRAGLVGNWVWAGAAAGLVVGVRLQDAMLLAVPAAVLGVGCLDRRAAGVPAVLAWSAGMGLGLLPQVLVWLRLEGSVVPVAEGALQAPSAINLLGVLFSSGYRGWISWTPVVLPALAGLVILAKRPTVPLSRCVALSGLCGIAGMVLLDVVHPFGAGAAFGGRRYVSATPFLAIGLATCLSPTVVTRQRRAQVAVCFVLLLGWNAWLLGAYELLTLRHGLRPTLAQTAKYGLGLGRP